MALYYIYKNVIKILQLNKEIILINLKLVECYRGVGVKRMRGYKCNLTIDKLNELREEYWGIRIRQKLIWQTIKQACIMDDGKRKLFSLFNLFTIYVKI